MSRSGGAPFHAAALAFGGALARSEIPADAADASIPRAPVLGNQPSPADSGPIDDVLTNALDETGAPLILLCVP